MEGKTFSRPAFVFFFTFTCQLHDSDESTKLLYFEFEVFNYHMSASLPWNPISLVKFVCYIRNLSVSDQSNLGT